MVIRELVRKGEKPRKELKLLSVQEDLYNYQVIAANSKAPGEKVWRVYNKRACCLPVRGTQTGENFIKESSTDSVWTRVLRGIGQVPGSISNWSCRPIT